MIVYKEHSFWLTKMCNYIDVYTLTAFDVKGGIFAHVGLIVYN